MNLILLNMNKEFNYISIDSILDRILRHPMMKDVTKEQIIQYTIDFIGIFGLLNLYREGEDTIEIKNHRGKLPCDLVILEQVLDCNTDTYLRVATNYNPCDYDSETYRVQGNIIFTSITNGTINIQYKGIAVDDDGFPMIPDNPIFLKALEAYIKKEIFTILFDTGKINAGILQNTQTQYHWLAGQLQAEFTMPTIDEMESIKNSWCTLIQRTHEFESGFKHLGLKEHLKLH